tara:strand:- start:7691 stop:8041 length:351 start_codon:yes stop_codon:yes gene_type:complete
MIGNGLSLALLTGAAFYLLFKKLPRPVRRWMTRHVLITDAVCMLLTYALFGGTLVALFAAAWLGLIISMMLFIMQNKEAMDVVETILEKIKGLFEDMWSWLKTKLPANNPDLVQEK